MSSVPVRNTTSVTDEDRRYLRAAIDLAARIPRRPWPNPPVGAVVVRDGVIVGEGAHHGAGLAHAERVALAAAGERARGATLYCTLEPCRHQGRTPPCTDAIMAAGVARVVVGIADPNPVAGGGAALLREAGVRVDLGVLAEPCLDLIWPFVCTDAFARPYVELKTAVSLDGRFTAPHDPAGRPVYLTGDEARDDVHRRRRWVDLVLVGAGTARQDRPRLDTRRVPDEAACPDAEPLAGCAAGRRGDDLILDRPSWLLFHDESRTVTPGPGGGAVACPAGPDGVDPAGLLAACADRGIRAIMLEGGPRLAAAFLAAGLVDRWVQYTAPVVTGGGASWPQDVPAPRSAFHLTRSEAVGRDLRTVWDRRDFADVLDRVTRTGRDR